MTPLEQSFERLDRSLKALILSFMGPALAQVGALIGPYSPPIGILLLVAGFGCLVYAAGLLISCAFVGQAPPLTGPDPLYEPREWSRSEPARIEDCHCMNHLNARSW